MILLIYWSLLIGCHREPVCSGCDEVCVNVITESRWSSECASMPEECPELQGLCTSAEESIAISDECRAAYEEECGDRIFSEEASCVEVCQEDDCSFIPYMDCYF